MGKDNNQLIDWSGNDSGKRVARTTVAVAVAAGAMRTASEAMAVMMAAMAAATTMAEAF